MTDPSPALQRLLASSTRRAILRALLEDDASAMTAMELSKLIRVDLPNVAYHVRVLEQFDGLRLDHVEDGRDGPRHFYTSGALVNAHPEYVRAILAQSEIKSALSDIADFCVERAY